MKDSWLVQRLNKPHFVQSPLGPDNPFAFGGGLRNGGLSKDAMTLLRPIFEFDYMGAAEFEFGAVPDALNEMAQHADTLVAFTISIPLRDVLGDRRDKSPVPDGDGTVYVVAQRDHVHEVTERVTGWATKNGPRLGEPTFLNLALRPFNEWDARRCGWLELDNGFFFFTDAEMWRKTAELFGVDIPQPVGSDTGEGSR